MQVEAPQSLSEKLIMTESYKTHTDPVGNGDLTYDSHNVAISESSDYYKLSPHGIDYKLSPQGGIESKFSPNKKLISDNYAISSYDTHSSHDNKFTPSSNVLSESYKLSASYDTHKPMTNEASEYYAQKNGDAKFSPTSASMLPESYKMLAITSESKYAGNHVNEGYQMMNHQCMDTAAPVNGDLNGTGGSRITCRFCGKQFAQAGYVKAHERLHTGEKPYRCSVCAKRFSDPSNWKKHEKVHFKNDKGSPLMMVEHVKSSAEQMSLLTRTTTFPSLMSTLALRRGKYSSLHHSTCTCKICGKLFASQSSLAIHKRIHTGERPYKCHECGKGFTQIGTLKTHERTHTGERPYECKICGKTFAQCGSFRMHEKRHLLDDVHNCQYCMSSFPNWQEHQMHMKTEHGEFLPYSANAYVYNVPPSVAPVVSTSITNGHRHSGLPVDHKAGDTSPSVYDDAMDNNDDEPFTRRPSGSPDKENKAVAVDGGIMGEMPRYNQLMYPHMVGGLPPLMANRECTSDILSAMSAYMNRVGSATMFNTAPTYINSMYALQHGYPIISPTKYMPAGHDEAEAMNLVTTTSTGNARKSCDEAYCSDDAYPNDRSRTPSASGSISRYPPYTMPPTSTNHTTEYNERNGDVIDDRYSSVDDSSTASGQSYEGNEPCDLTVVTNNDDGRDDNDDRSATVVQSNNAVRQSAQSNSIGCQNLNTKIISGGTTTSSSSSRKQKHPMRRCNSSVSSGEDSPEPSCVGISTTVRTPPMMEVSDTEDSTIVSKLLTDGKVFKCHHCRIIFEDCTLYLLHNGFHCHDDDPFRCGICREMCKDRVDFNCHLMSHIK